MENTIKVSKIPTIGLAVIIAVIGFTFAACGDGGGGGAGHVHDWGEWEITPATCKDTGLKTRACILDPSHTEEEKIPEDPNGHDFGESETVTKEPTCDENGEGEAEGTCIFCGEKTTKTLAKLDHDYEYVTIPATCTTAGSETGTCTRNLLHTDSRNIDIDPDAHDYQWTVITPATYTTEGEEKEICTPDATHKRGTRAIAMLTIPPYIITGSGTAFTATRDGATVGTADQPIQNVINDIRTDADGEECIIQFGNKTDTLDIGTASASFNNTGGTWGAVTLKGKITGNVNTATTGTIVIADTVSITSTADIANTGGTNGRAVYHNSTGTFTVTGGTVSGETGRAIHNQTTATINISGGTVSATTGSAVYSQTTGTVTISGGTVSGTTGYAVYNGYGTITISGTALVTSEANYDSLIGNPGRTPIATVYNERSGTVNITGGTVQNTGTGHAVVNNMRPNQSYSGYDGTVNISGGTVQNKGTGSTAAAVMNAGVGTVNITGGTVQNTGTAHAVFNFGLEMNLGGSPRSGKITVSGTAMITSAGELTILNGSSGVLEITGGTIENTNATSGFAVGHISTRTVTISGGTVQATGEESAAVRIESTGTVTITGGTILATGTEAYTIYNNSTGAVTVTSPPTVIDKDKTYGTITWVE